MDLKLEMYSKGWSEIVKVYSNGSASIRVLENEH